MTDRYTYIRTIDGPWLLYDNLEDPYQLDNLVDHPGQESLRERLESMMEGHLRRIGDQFLHREAYYERFGIEIDHRGKVVGIMENMYDRRG